MIIIIINSFKRQRRTYFIVNFFHEIFGDSSNPFYHIKMIHRYFGKLQKNFRIFRNETTKTCKSFIKSSQISGDWKTVYNFHKLLQYFKRLRKALTTFTSFKNFLYNYHNNDVITFLLCYLIPSLLYKT